MLTQTLELYNVRKRQGPFMPGPQRGEISCSSPLATELGTDHEKPPKRLKRSKCRVLSCSEAAYTLSFGEGISFK